MIKRLNLAIWACCIVFASSGVGFTQEPINSEDYDVIFIEAARSIAPQGRDLTSDRLEERGMSIYAVEGYTLPENRIVGDDIIAIQLQAGEAFRLMSEPIVMSATSVYLSAQVSIDGATPQQAAMAIIDLENTSNLAASISVNGEIPMESQNFSLTYQRLTNQFVFIIQAVGPVEGVSVITIRNIRLLDGYHELDFRLDSTQISEIQHFGSGRQAYIVNDQVTTEGGHVENVDITSRTEFADAEDRSLLLRTESSTDIVQIYMLFDEMLTDAIERIQSPASIFPRAYIKRLSGENGLLTIAAVGSSTSIGNSDYPMSTFATDSWTEIEHPVRLERESAEGLILIFQLNGGPAEVLIDDVSIHANKDSMFIWDVDAVRDLELPGIPEQEN
jgi:hypothetical protein